MEADMATGFGEADKGPGEMAKARYAKVIVLSGIFLLAAVLLFFGSVKLAKLGLSVVLLVIFFIKIGAGHLEREGNRLKKRAKQAEKGAERALNFIHARQHSIPRLTYGLPCPCLWTAGAPYRAAHRRRGCGGRSSPRF